MSAALKIQPGDPLLAEVAARGFALVRGNALSGRLGAAGEAAALEEFAASWDRLETDGFMADGGRYRRRRLANYRAKRGHAWACPGTAPAAFPGGGAQQPEWRGGAVVRAHRGCGGARARPCMRCWISGAPSPTSKAPGQDWFVEVHQFRIEAVAGAPGYPTPEGVHHDGVDMVLIGMVARTNLVGGETLITDNAGGELARFTLLDRLDTAFIDDGRVMHGVTPVQPADPGRHRAGTCW